MTNCHISYKENYYSIPYVYIGEIVSASVIDNILKVYYSEKETALHSVLKNETVSYVTNKSHYPKNKNIASEEIKSSYRKEMVEISQNSLKFFDAFIEDAIRKCDYITMASILFLKNHYDDKTIDYACLRSYTYVNYKETWASRPLSEYSKFLN